jgi:hypothetical protein
MSALQTPKHAVKDKELAVLKAHIAKTTAGSVALLVLDSITASKATLAELLIPCRYRLQFRRQGRTSLR